MQNINAKNPLQKEEGNTVEITNGKGLSYGTFRVMKTGDSYANLEPMDSPANTTPANVPMSPAQTKTESADDKLIAALTNPAVMAVLKQLINS